MEQEKNKLLPCPFCGSTNVNDTSPPSLGDYENGYYWVCPDCVCCGPVEKSIDAATKHWNTRSLESHMKWIEQTEKDFAEATTKIVSGSG